MKKAVFKHSKPKIICCNCGAQLSDFHNPCPACGNEKKELK